MGGKGCKGSARFSGRASGKDMDRVMVVSIVQWCYGGVNSAVV